MVAPVRLDPFQRIINVGWGGAKIAAYLFNVRWQARVNYSDSPSLHDASPVPSYSPLTQLATFPGNLHVALPLFNVDMLGRGYAWSYPPYMKDNSTTGTETVTIIDEETVFFQPLHSVGWPFSGDFTNSTVDGLTVPGSPYSSPLACAVAYFTTYWNAGGGVGGPGMGPGTAASWTDLSPLLFGGAPDPHLRTHTESHTFTSYDITLRALTFFNLGLMKAVAKKTIFSFQVDTEGSGSASNSYAWSQNVATYKGKTLFPAVNNEPAWPYTSISNLAIGGDQAAESTLPAYRTTFQIDLSTLLVTGNKV